MRTFYVVVFSVFITMMVFLYMRDRETRVVAVYPSIHRMELYSWLSCEEAHSGVCMKHDVTSSEKDVLAEKQYEELRAILCRSQEWSSAAACVIPR